jgi:arylsulfatase A-like enzyme
MPTMLDYLGLPVPTDGNLPGSSFAGLLRGGAVDSAEHVVIYDEYGPVRMIRTRDWKYVYRHGEAPDELFHLSNDPDEREDLAGEPAHESRVRELRGAMEEWFARYVVPGRDGVREDDARDGQDRLVR